jgi:hypothetical protein
MKENVQEAIQHLDNAYYELVEADMLMAAADRIAEADWVKIAELLKDTVQEVGEIDSDGAFGTRTNS